MARRVAVALILIVSLHLFVVMAEGAEAPAGDSVGIRDSLTVRP